MKLKVLQLKWILKLGDHGGSLSSYLKQQKIWTRYNLLVFSVDLYNCEINVNHKVMNAGEHVINGKRVDPKKAKARSGKIFVGGLPQDTTEETIRSFFGTFGNVIYVLYSSKLSWLNLLLLSLDC